MRSSNMPTDAERLNSLRWHVTWILSIKIREEWGTGCVLRSSASRAAIAVDLSLQWADAGPQPSSHESHV